MPCLPMTLFLLLQSTADLPSHVTVDGRMDPGALLFLLVSWACVLGLTVWGFAKILRVQARRSPSSVYDGPISADEHVPPAA